MSDKNNKPFKHCPDCGNKQTYLSKEALKNAKENNTFCKSCANKGRRNPNYKEVTEEEKDVEYSKNCPECRKKQTYSSKYLRNRADRENTLCHSCAMSGERNPAYKENKEYKKDCPGCEKILEYEYSSGLSMSKKYNWYCSSCAANGKNKKDHLWRKCPGCEKKIYYSREKILEEAEENNSECRKCNSADQPSPTKYIDEFSEEHRRKIGESSTERLKGKCYEERYGKRKAEEVKRKLVEGQTDMDYDEYIESLPEKRRYERKARLMSKRRELEKLENYDEDEYELDHIFPVSKGFEYNISLEAISSLDNLQMLPRMKNKKKGNSIPENVPDVVKEEIEEI